MYYNILNSSSIQNYIPKGNTPILIRVLEPSYKYLGTPYQITNIDKYKAVLELYLDDTKLTYDNKDNIFNYETAKILNDFILKNEFDEIVVHCSLGISRSPAIMICIAKILNNKKLENIIKKNYKFYNSHITDIFEKNNYSIKKIKNPNNINGNILDKKTDQETNYILKKILK